MADWWQIVLAILGGISTVIVLIPLTNKKIKNLISSILAFVIDFLPLLRERITEKRPFTEEEMEWIYNNLMAIKDDILELRNSLKKQDIITAKNAVITKGELTSWEEAKTIISTSNKTNSLTTKVKTVSNKVKTSLTKSEET